MTSMSNQIPQIYDDIMIMNTVRFLLFHLSELESVIEKFRSTIYHFHHHYDQRNKHVTIAVII